MAAPKKPSPPRIMTEGRIVQSKQGFHGIKGGEKGQRYGIKALVSEQYKLWEAQKRTGTLPADKKGGRRKKAVVKDEATSDVDGDDMEEKQSKQRKYVKCMESLTFSEQLRFIDIYRKRVAQCGTTAVYADAGRGFSDRFDTDYGGKTSKRNVRRRMKEIIADERRLRYARACGFGEMQRWHKGLSYHNPTEPKIAAVLNQLKRQNVKIDKRLRTEIALKLTADAGIPCSKPKDDGFLCTLESNERENVNSIIERSQRHLTDDTEYIFNPTDNWAHNFNKRWGFEYGSNKERGVNIISLLSNLRSSLLYVYVMRRLYNVPVHQGRILNADQSMWYRYYQCKKSWK